LTADPKGLKFYTIFIIGVGLIFLVLLSLEKQLSWETGKVLIFWAILILIAESFPVSLPHGGYVTLGFPVVYAVLLTQGPAMGSWIAVCGALTALREYKKGGVHKALFNGAQLTISVCAAWLVYRQSGGTLILADSPEHFLPLGFAALTYFAINTLAVSTVLALQRRTSIIDMWLNNFKWTVPNYLAQTPLGFLMAVIYRQISWWAVTFVMLPLFIAYSAYKLYMNMQKEHLSIIQALAAAVEARDPYTEKHSQRMAEYAMKTARELGLSIYSTEIIRYAAILHDIGKIGVSDEILSKSDSLNTEEWDEIKKHSTIGAEILAQINSFSEVSRLVYHHHERYNGTGYPQRLQGENIPLGSRIIAVIDAYDAMISHRPYRKAYSKEEAIAELKRCAGKQFDKKVVEAFLKVLRNAT